MDAYYTDLFLRAFAICVVLTGIHGYLGIHVLSRQVIFVDLAMAQVAALGSTYALLLGYDPTHHPEDTLPAYLFSLAFTLAGAAVFAATRMRHERLPQEAVIGIVYATTSALVVLILSKSPTAGEQIRHMLVGNILLVGWPAIARTALIYAAIGVVHWVFRRPFLRITFDPDGAARAGIRIRLWDFLFYATFGIVITSSVAIGGVLLVFTFLVVPAAIAVLWADSISGRIVTGWVVGTLVSAAGVLLSFWADVPSGPAVVAAFAAALLLAGLLRFVVHAGSVTEVLMRVGIPAFLVALAFQGTGYLAKDVPHRHSDEHSAIVEALQEASEAQQIDALHHVEESPDPHLLPHVRDLAERTTSERVLEHAAEALAHFPNENATRSLVDLATRVDDPFLRIRLGEILLERRSAEGLRILIALLRDQRQLVRTQAIARLRKLTGQTLGYDPDLPPEDNRDALARWQQRAGR